LNDGVIFSDMIRYDGEKYDEYKYKEFDPVAVAKSMCYPGSSILYPRRVINAMWDFQKCWDLDIPGMEDWDKAEGPGGEGRNLGDAQRKNNRKILGNSFGERAGILGGFDPGEILKLSAVTIGEKLLVLKCPTITLESCRPRNVNITLTYGKMVVNVVVTLGNPTNRCGDTDNVARLYPLAKPDTTGNTTGGKM